MKSKLRLKSYGLCLWCWKARRLERSGIRFAAMELLELLEQLLESARLVKQLSHPHIMKFIEFYRSEHGDHVLVIEWLECDLGKY